MPRKRSSTSYYTVLTLFSVSIFIFLQLLRATQAAKRQLEDPEGALTYHAPDDQAAVDALIAMGGARFFQYGAELGQAALKRPRHKQPAHAGKSAPKYAPHTTKDLLAKLPDKTLEPIGPDEFESRIQTIKIKFGSTTSPSAARDNLEAGIRQALKKILPHSLLTKIADREGFLIRIVSKETMARLFTGSDGYLPAVRYRAANGAVVRNRSNQPYIVLNYDFLSERPARLPDILANELFHIAVDWAEEIDEQTEVYDELYPPLYGQSINAAIVDWIGLQELRNCMLQRRDMPYERLTDLQLEKVRKFTRLAREYSPLGFFPNYLSKAEFDKTSKLDKHGNIYFDVPVSSKNPLHIERRYVLSSEVFTNDHGEETVHYIYSYARPNTLSKPITATERAFALLEQITSRTHQAYMDTETLNQDHAEELASDVSTMVHSDDTPDGVAELLFPNTIDFWTQRIGHEVFKKPEAEIALKRGFKKR